MRFSIVNVDKKKQLHLQVKSAEWFFDRIKTDTKSETIGKLRRYIEVIGDNGEYERNNPIATVLPLVELVKSANGNLDIEKFNGLVPLHVGDLLRKDDILAVKEAAKMMPMTYAAFFGADGRSVEILVSVAPKEGALPQSEADIDQFCKQAYDVAYGAYSGILPKPVKGQSVVARSGFRLTLDAEPYVNTGAVPLKVDGGMLFSKAVQSSAEVPEQREMDMDLYADYEMMYKQAAEEAYAEITEVIESQRLEAYVTEIARRMCLKGVPEEETYLHIRNHYIYDDLYDKLELRAIVDAVYAENKPQRMENGSSVSKNTRRLIKFLTTRYVFRYNTVMGYTEYRPNNTWIQDWAVCDENVINGMSIEARLANIDVRDKDVRRYVRSNMIRKCDPLEEFFWNIRDAWDGKTDHIGMLARTVPCDIPQWETWFRRWFLSMVAQWLGQMRDYGNSLVPLLISPQGDGKSFFCRNLLPKELQWGYLENLVVEEKKQTLQAMHNFLLIGLDEFNQISQKTQEGFLKNVIQLPRVKIKRPYGKHVEDFKRMASFIATTNESGVLCDPTGSRRFIGVELTAPINTDYKPNYAALYNQAYTLVMKREEQYWMTPAEVEELMVHNRQFELKPPAVQYFNEYFEPAIDESEGQWKSPTAIYDRLRQVAGSGLKANGVAAFGRYLKMIPGLQQRRVGNSRQYLVHEK